MLDFIRRRRLRLPHRELRERKRTLNYFLFGGATAGLWLAALLNHHLRTTVSYGWEWWLLLVILVSAFLAHLKRLHAEDLVSSSAQLRSLPLVPAFWILLIAITAAAIIGCAVFWGVPTVLHRLMSQPGEMTVTVIAKDASFHGRRSLTNLCRPRLEIAEFTGLRAFVCTDRETYKTIVIGSKIQLRGRVSPFGIDSEYLSWPPISDGEAVNVQH